MRITYLDAPAYVVDDAVLERYPQRRTVFARRATDLAAPFYRRSEHERALARAQAPETGYTQVDAAMASAAWTVASHCQGAYSWEPLGAPASMLRDLGPYSVKDPVEMSAQVKRAALSYGARLAGIARLDRRRLYAQDNGGRAIAMPDGVDWAIVMAVPMDPAGLMASPGFDAATATGVGYSRMAFAAACLAQFIRTLGYRAIPAGNDTALSVPLASDAGLGEMGRNGMLVTPQSGASIRLCKVFTDLPLAPDRPITFGLVETCRTCRRCAEACPAGAISADPAPSFAVACPSNDPGVKHWAVNADRCYTYWMDNGTDCSTCIVACPFTQAALARIQTSGGDVSQSQRRRSE